MADGGDVRVSLTLDDQLTNGIRQADNAVLAFAGSTSRMIMSLGRLTPAVAAFTGVGLVVRGAASEFANYEQRVAALNASLGASPDQLKALGTQQLQLSRDTVFTASQIADSQILLARSGADSNKIMSETPDILNLASAAASSTTIATRALVSVQDDFGKKAGSSAQIVDILAKASNSGIGTLTDLQQAIKQVGPVAGVSGIQTKEFAATIEALMNAGLQGDAGTAMKVFLQRITHETPAAAKEIDRLGLSFFDAQGNMKSMSDIADELHAKLGNLSPQELGNVATTIFGTRGVRVADIFAEQGASGIQDVIDHMDRLPDAADIAKSKLDTLSGSFHQLTSSMSAAAVQLGSALEPTLRSGTDGFKLLADGLSKIPTPALSAIVGLAAIRAEMSGFNAVGNMYATRFGTINQAIDANSKKMNDRAAIMAQWNQVQDKASYLEEKYAQTVAAGGNTAAIDSKYTQIKQQEQLIQGGASSTQVRAFAQRQEEYNNDLAAYQSYVQKKATFEDREAARVQTAAEKGIAAQDKYFQKQAYAVTHNEPVPKAPDLSKYEVTPREYPGQVITPPIEVNPRDVKLAGGGIGKIKSAITGSLAGLGEIVGAVTIVLTAKQLILDPIIGAVKKADYDNAVKSIEDIQTLKDKQRQTANRDGRGQGADPSYGELFDSQGNPSGVNSMAFYQQQLDDAEALKAAAEKKKAEIEAKYNDNRHSGDILGNLLNDPSESVATLGQDVKDLFGAGGGDVSGYEAEIAKQDKVIESVKASMKDNPQKVKTFMSEMGTQLEQEVLAGRLTEQQAIDRANKSANMLMPGAGASQDNVTDYVQAEDKRIHEQAMARQQQIEDDAALYEEQSNRAALLKQLNVPAGIISGDAAGMAGDKKYADNAIKEYQQLGAKVDAEMAKMTIAANAAASAVGKIDFTKGFSGLDKVLPDLQRATLLFKDIGADTSGLDKLTEIGTAFDKIKTAFEGSQSMINFRGGEAMLGVTDESISMLDTFGKKVKEVSDVAREAQSHGIATDDQKTLLQDESGIMDSISEQVRKLYASEAGDVLNIAKNLPDLVEYNNQIREMVKGFGGVATVQGTIEEASKRATSEAMNVKSITEEVASHPDLIKLRIDPVAHADVLRDLDLMNGDISKLTENDWNVIVQAIMGDSLESLKTLQGILAAVPSEKNIRVSITQDQTALDYQKGQAQAGNTDSRTFSDEINADIANKQARVVTLTIKGDDTDLNGMLDTDSAAAEAKQAQMHITAESSGAIAQINATVAYANRQEATIRVTTVTVGGPTGGGGGNSGNYANGGDVRGDWAVVGDTPSGDMSAAELVDFKNRRVMSHKEASARGMFGGGIPRYAGGVGGIDTTAGADPGYVGDAAWGHLPKVDLLTAGVQRATKALKEAGAAAQQLGRSVYDASESASLLGDNLANMKSDQIKEIVKYYDLLDAANKKVAASQLPLKPTQEQTDAANVAASQKTLSQVAAISLMLTQGNIPLEQQSQLWSQISEQLGPIGPLIRQQVQDYMAVENNLRTIDSLQASLKTAEEAHTQRVQDAQDAEKAYQRSIEDRNVAEQQADTMMNRADTLQQWHIEDARQRTQRRWEDESKGIEQARKAAEDYYKIQTDAITQLTEVENADWTQKQRNFQDEKTLEDNTYTAISRQEEDQKRFLDFYGTQRKKDLQDELVLLQSQYKQITQTNGAQEQLLQAKTKNATSNADAYGFATQLAVLKEYDTIAQRNEKTQEDNIKLAIDAEARLASQEQYDLETQTLAEKRAHEDKLNQIDTEQTADQRVHENLLKAYQDEAKAQQTYRDAVVAGLDDQASRLQDYQAKVNRYWQDEDKALTRSHTYRQWSIDDLKAAQAAADLQHKRDYEDATQTEQRAFDDFKKGTQDTIDNLTKANADMNKQADALGSLITMWGTLSQYAGDTADVLTAALGAYLVAGGNTGTPHARGGVMSGLSLVGENGPELVHNRGVAMDAASTANILAMAMGMGNKQPTMQTGDVHFHIHQAEGQSAEALVVELRAMVVDLQAQVQKMRREDNIYAITGGRR